MSKSIQRKFLLWVLPILTVLLVILGFSIHLIVKKSQESAIENFSFEIAGSNADQLNIWLNSIINELQRIAEHEDVASMDWGRMQPYLKKVVAQRNNTYGFMLISGPDGAFYTSTKGKADGNISDRDYFKAIFNQKKGYFITNPMISRALGVRKFNIAVPVKDSLDQVHGLLAGSISLTTFSKIVSSINISNMGNGFVVDNTGTIAAHPVEDIIMKMNIFENPEEFAYNFSPDMIENIKQNKTCSGLLRIKDTSYFALSIPIESSPGWNLGIIIPEKKIFSEVNILIRYLVIFFIFTLLSIFVLIWQLSSRFISRPLHILIDYIEVISSGNLTKVIHEISDNEIGRSIKALNEMATKIKEVILRVQENASSIKDASQSLSSSSEMISEGASEQASNTKEISGTMEIITSNIKQNHTNAMDTEKLSDKTKDEINGINTTMKEAVDSNRSIAEKIKIINEIAFQINLLALNASVEAARAGQHGKGFAVIAAEVRKLADKSKNAADNIVEQAQLSYKIIENAGSKMEQVLPDVYKTTQLIKEILQSNSEQKDGVLQVSQSIRQLDDIAQNNASSSEELASSAEEFSAQAIQLSELVSFFRTK